MQQLKDLIKINNNVNVNNNIKTNVNVNNVTGIQVHNTAQALCDKFSDQNSFQYFCKVAWKLPEHIINNNYEMAQKGHNPVKLFVYLCNLDMAKLC